MLSHRRGRRGLRGLRPADDAESGRQDLSLRLPAPKPGALVRLGFAPLFPDINAIRCFQTAAVAGSDSHRCATPFSAEREGDDNKRLLAAFRLPATRGGLTGLCPTARRPAAGARQPSFVRPTKSGITPRSHLTGLRILLAAARLRAIGGCREKTLAFSM